MEAFERLIAEELQAFAVDLIAYQWMSNIVLSPRVDNWLLGLCDN